MDSLLIPPTVRVKLGEAGSDGLMTMFADAHRLATESFEQRLDRNTEVLSERFERRLVQNGELLTERFERRLADLRADLLKWSFLFWIGQLAAIAGMLAVLLPGR